MILCWQQKESALAILYVGTVLPESNHPYFWSQDKPRDKKLYEYYYVPETIEYFTGFTLLVVERELRPGPGMFLAQREENGKKQLCSFQISYKGLDQSSTRSPDMQTIGRVRIMDYWELNIRK
ncbi:hypothetical protein [Endozoicomonas ascidiicola]|uniref:hypothetical protein n=1 Tax=Endozoicomonas ascidiicola TaxID=1698521 RepID=UPI0008296946|nr:hypothetical protein [Endozoicomonas ascidiicola]